MPTLLVFHFNLILDMLSYLKGIHNDKTCSDTDTIGYVIVHVAMMLACVACRHTPS